MSLRSAFAEAVTQEMGNDEKIVLLLGDIGVYSFRPAFDRFPSRCLNLGAAECGMVGFGVGLALEGYFPVISCIEAHLLRRGYEFIRLGFAEQGLKALFVGVGGAHEYARLGPTHECPEGMHLAGHLFDRVYAPVKEPSVKAWIHHAVRDRELCYLRLEEQP